MGEFATPGQQVGKRLLPHVLDYLGRECPQKLFATYHEDGEEYQKGWVDLNFKQFAQAVDWTSWWIEKTVGKSTTCEVLAYMGPNDLRYAIFTIASMKTGHATLLPSPRNSIEGHLHLLKETGCKHFIYSLERKLKVLELEHYANDVHFWQLPSLTEILAGQSEWYPFTKAFDEAEQERAIIIHSSGSTGLPKLVPMTNGYISIQDKFSLIPPTEDGRRAVWTVMAPDERSLCINPLFHLMGLYMFQESLFHGIPVVIAPDRNITAELLTDVLTTTKPTIAILPPSLIEELSRSEDGRFALSQLRTIISGGAPLSQEVAARVSQLTRLTTVYGTSEIGVVACLIPRSKDDYKYLEWHPAYGIEMDPVDDNLFEAVIVRGPKSDLHAVFHSYPELQQYRTNDLFTRHPTNQGLWLYNGRKDDVIVLNNGEKFNPIIMEKYLEEHPSIKKALVLGQARFQSLLLVEPDWDIWDGQQSEKAFVDHIWSYVEEGNKLIPTYGQIMKSHIGITSRELAFRVTPKGTIQRKAVMEDYSEKIEELYAKGGVLSGPSLPEDPDLEQIIDFVLQIVIESMPEADISATSDLFSSGLDSLQTLRLAKTLQGALNQLDGRKGDEVSPARLYKTPTAAKIAKFIYHLIYDDGVNVLNHATNEPHRGLEKGLDHFVDKYTADLPPSLTDTLKSPSKHTVILTGSTGYLGTYILNRLLQDPNVTHVYSLNRSTDAYTRTKVSFEQRGLNFSPAVRSKVTFWPAQFGEERLGLDENKYNELRLSVDLIIHNAWKVDFNHALESFEDTHIRGIRRLVDFSYTSPLHPHLVFISSVSTIGRWNSTHGPSCPETTLSNPELVVPSGYGLSKHIAERILNISALQSGVPNTIIRVGQIGGPTVGPGHWNTQDWVPMVIKTSKAIAAIPDSLSYMPIDWVPVDSAANVISEVIQTRQDTQMSSRCEVFHLINPTPSPWKSLLPAVHRNFAAKVISFSEWVDMVKSIPITEDALLETPAVKLVDFLQGLEALKDWKQPPFETIRAQAASEALKSLPPVNEELMDLYLQQWRF